MGKFLSWMSYLSSVFSAHKTQEAFAWWFKTTYPDRYMAVIKKAQSIMAERQAIQEFVDTGLVSYEGSVASES